MIIVPIALLDDHIVNVFSLTHFDQHLEDGRASGSIPQCLSNVVVQLVCRLERDDPAVMVAAWNDAPDLVDLRHLFQYQVLQVILLRH